jgi:hypothetical protein
MTSQANLLWAYRASSSDARRLLDDLLATHVYLAGGHHPYMLAHQANSVDRIICFRQILQFDWELANAWFEWAEAIQGLHTTKSAVLKIVGRFIFDTVSLKSLERSIPGYGEDFIEIPAP